jgi:hypothetical protein
MRDFCAHKSMSWTPPIGLLGEPSLSWLLFSNLLEVDRVHLIDGGLGNQLFQHAYAIALKKSDPARAYLDIGRYSRRSAHNGYEADRVFTLEGAVPPLGRALSALTFRAARLMRDFNYEGPSIAHQPAFLRQGIKGYIKGYFPSYRYFQNAELEVRRAFVFRLPLPERCAGLAKEVADGDSVAVHVRRGDFIDARNSSTFAGICTPKYYVKAVEILRQRRPKARFYFFSDDPAWCRSTFDGVATKVVEGNVGADAWADMALMSRCRHAIIANSSFSWWGRWIGGFEASVCVAPSRLLNPGAIISRIEDFVPEQFAIISPEGVVLRELP